MFYKENSNRISRMKINERLWEVIKTITFHFSIWLFFTIFITFLTKKIHNNFFKRLHLRSLKTFQKWLLNENQTHHQKRGGVFLQRASLKTRRWEWNLYPWQKTSSKSNIIKLHHLIGYRKILILLSKLNSPDYQTKMDQITNY